MDDTLGALILLKSIVMPGTPLTVRKPFHARDATETQISAADFSELLEKAMAPMRS